MTEYLTYQFTDSEEFVSTFDELPLWSAAFGLLLLKHLPLKKSTSVIDIGSGAGFPLLELAARLGSTCKLYGVDPWINANNRARQKIKNYDLTNVEIIDGSAEKLPFDDASIDLVVSNLGVNNFENPAIVFKEVRRVLKKGGKLALTTNLNGHWKEFYSVFETVLGQLGKKELLEKLSEHEAHRGSVASLSTLFSDGGLRVSRHFEERFEMRFADGSAFLNHYFVKLGWLGSWRDLLPPEDLVNVFTALEAQLNNLSNQKGELSLSVPMCYIEGEKA